MILIGAADANDMLLEVSLDRWSGYIGLSWNQWGGFWTMSLRNLDSDILVSGLAVLPMWPLLRQTRRPEYPPGEFIVGCDPALTLGRRSFADGAAALVYFDPEDIAEIAAGG